MSDYWLQLDLDGDQRPLRITGDTPADLAQAVHRPAPHRRPAPARHRHQGGGVSGHQVDVDTACVIKPKGEED